MRAIGHGKAAGTLQEEGSLAGGAQEVCTSRTSPPMVAMS